MGEVYRATDTRLERAVAIKVLPAAFSSNAQLKVRFEREAKTISGLGHPHICTLYDVGHENGIDYLVLELLEGESLADRLARGPLPIEQVLRYGAQIAQALEKAHRHGIVHRDLKPGNIMLTKSGAKLLDFGLARAGAQPVSDSDLTVALATEHKPLTQEGTIVGTFQYMAPEQFDGRPADARSDIFALGAVLYEMATGKRAFDGKSKASLIASILDRDPQPISALQPMTPPAFERLVQSCLRKDPDERWQSAHDIASELQWIIDGGSNASLAAPVVAARKRREFAWMAATVVLALAAIALAYALFARKTPVASEVRAQIAPPAQTTFDIFQDGAAAVTISPDGKWITFATRDDKEQRQLWLRAIDSVDARPLAGAEKAVYPFWSPDSRSIGFFAGGKMKRLDVSGGPATTITDSIEPRGAAWGKDGTIIFAPHWRGALMRVAAAGGKAEPLTTLDASRSETTHRYPFFLPDGEHFLYLAGTHLQGPQSELNAIYVASLRTNERKLLLRARSNAIYAAGHLLFVRDNYLLAQPFDPGTLALSGEPRRLADSVHYEAGFFRAVFSAAGDGTLVFAPRSPGDLRRLFWFDRKSGKETELPFEPAMYRTFSVSPDGKKIAVEIDDPADLWILDPQRGVRQRLTSNPLNEMFPAWSPDGRSVAYVSDRDVHMDIYLSPTDGHGGEVRLVGFPDANELPASFSPDGRFLAFDSSPLKNANAADIWLLPLTGGNRNPFPLIQTPANEWGAMFSPDGKWLAFVSDESGRDELYLARADGSGVPQQVSTSGVINIARWRADGKELFYVAADGTVTAVQVTAAADGVETAPGQPLFKLSRGMPFTSAPDGQRFVIARGEPPDTTPLTLVTGWTAKRE